LPPTTDNSTYSPTDTTPYLPTFSPTTDNSTDNSTDYPTYSPIPDLPTLSPTADLPTFSPTLSSTSTPTLSPAVSKSAKGGAVSRVCQQISAAIIDHPSFHSSFVLFYISEISQDPRLLRSRPCLAMSPTLSPTYNSTF
jgi:hypothetical protein